MRPATWIAATIIMALATFHASMVTKSRYARMIPATTLQQLVPVAHFRGNCAHSPENVSDDFIAKAGTKETVVGIASVHLGDRVVGWIYRTASGHFFAQGRRSMPEKDRNAAGIVGINPNAYGDPYSGLVEITRVPWKTLKVQGCISHTK